MTRRSLVLGDPPALWVIRSMGPRYGRHAGMEAALLAAALTRSDRHGTGR